VKQFIGASKDPNTQGQVFGPVLKLLDIGIKTTVAESNTTFHDNSLQILEFTVRGQVNLLNNFLSLKS
jgi:hypothetical protein